MAISKVTEQELDPALQLALEKAANIDVTLQQFYEGIMQEVSRVNRLADNSRRNADPLGAYPDGITIMRINIEGMGFPHDFGVVVTHKSGSYGFQIFSNNSADTGGFPIWFIRSWLPAISQWTEWDHTETAAGAQAKADEKVDASGDTMTGFLTLHANPVNPMHAATKDYVDSVLEGLDVKSSVKVATTGALAVASSTSTRLTLSSALSSIDGVALSAGDRILVKDQTDARQNGIYHYISSTVLDRTEDADSSEKVTPGMYVFIEAGTAHSDSGWVLTTNGTITLGSTNLSFVQFSGAGQITVQNGLSKNGNTLSIADTGVTPGIYTKVTVNSRGQATSGGLLTETDIPSLGASKIGSGVFGIARIPTGTTATTVALGNHTHALQDLSNVVLASVTAGQFLRFTGTEWANEVMTAADIPDLDAAKIVSGAFHVDRIPSLPASKITSGVFNIARIPTGSTSTTVALGNHTHSGYEDRMEDIEQTRPEIPIGMEGQVAFVDQDYSNQMELDYLVTEVMAVDNDTDLAGAKEVFVSNKDIFDKWSRFSHNSTANQPADPNEITQWRYDEVNDLVITTVNSATYIGFYSDKKYDNYVHQARLTSSNSDDDLIGLLIAFAVDQNGREHTLSAVRTRAGIFPEWGIIYNHARSDAKVIANGTSLLSVLSGNQGWSLVPNGTVVRVHRQGDIIEATTSEMDSLQLNPNTKLTVDLTSDPVLSVFRGPQPYGYTSYSQLDSTYRDIYFSDAANVIYDIRTGDVWVANATGNYAIDASKSVADLGKGRILSNAVTGKMFFVRNDGKVVSLGSKSFRKNIVLAAGDKLTIDAHAEFGPNVNARNLMVQATVKDTDLASPTYGMFINSEAVATVAKDDRYIVVVNEYSTALEFDVVVMR
jgi:hypothetical protein